MSRIIRGKSRVIPRGVLDAIDKAEQIVNDANARANSIIAGAESDAEAIRGAAREQGEQAGRAEAARLLMQTQQAKEASLRAVESSLVSLAMKAAEKLVHEVAKESPERIRKTVADLLERSARATSVTVRVHPKDAAIVEGLHAEGFAFGIAQDGNLARGECVVESDLGELDARFSVQLEALERALSDNEQ